MKERVDQHVYHRTQTKLRTVELFVSNLQEEVHAIEYRLESRLNNTVDAVRILDHEAIRLSPWAFSLLSLSRKVWRTPS